MRGGVGSGVFVPVEAETGVTERLGLALLHPTWRWKALMEIDRRRSEKFVVLLMGVGESLSLI